MLNARTDSNQAEIVQALRDLGASVILLHRVGRGCPDIMVGWNHKTILMEIKTEEGKERPGQRKAREAWDGGRWVVVHNIDEALRAIGAME